MPVWLRVLSFVSFSKAVWSIIPCSGVHVHVHVLSVGSKQLVIDHEIPLEMPTHQARKRGSLQKGYRIPPSGVDHAARHRRSAQSEGMTDRRDGQSEGTDRAKRMNVASELWLVDHDPG